ncbi:FHF complex subunit HOOK interacting protein 1A [Echinops telfairi]|uniref:FHF complex subunit HOOK interacting protein 1A n=1 Tax=Echinops telfairi TaxID=9371 RepID=A0AC55DJ12_ECHTE|nr:FHF complex subunit HOOK interacting protein 1A [Echinops telfairi]
MMSSIAKERKLQQAVSLRGVDPETCMIVFRNHWAQVVKILEKHDPLKNIQARYGSIPPDEASAVQNYVEHMLFLLIEEQAKDAAMGPILEFVVSENIMEKLFLWSLRREFTDETKLEQLRMYEMLVTQSHQPLLHHKPILKPLMMLLSTCSGTATPMVEGKLVVLLNQLCSILAKDPSILELFFHTSEDQGAANFLIFSLLIPFIHREGTVGQQARDALLFIMSLSAENSMVAHHIVENTYFCPVLATGLSGLYSSLPTKLEEKGEEWHCLLKDDWLLLPPLVQFLNSLEFCNAVIQVAHPLIRNQLVNYIYNGFLVPVLAPALHKVTVEEVMTTTAYLDLFLRSVSEPALLEIFLRFILLHQHENVHILDTLTSRINTPFRLCVVSLALFRTLIGLHCEDVMLQLVLRYLIPCNHMMLSQRWAVKERDCYSVSAAKLLALTPVCCSSGITLTLGHQERDFILWSKCVHESAGPEAPPLPATSSPSACIVEYGKALDISYLQYLWEAHTNILHCMRDCRVWSALYDGDSPDPETFLRSLCEEGSRNPALPVWMLQYPLPSKPSTQPAPGKDKGQTELEWDDSYDTGISSGADANSPGTPPAPIDPPRHIQEMKKSAIQLFKGSYIEELDFQDDVMVYRLCADKDCEDPGEAPASAQTEDQRAPVHNGPLPSPQPEADPGQEHAKASLDLMETMPQERPHEDAPAEVGPDAPACEAELHAGLPALDPESEDLIAQYDQIIKELDSGTEGLMEQTLPDPLLGTQEGEEKGGETRADEEEEEEAGKKDLDEDEDDFDSLLAETPAETTPSPFGAREETAGASHHPARTQGAPFTVLMQAQQYLLFRVDMCDMAPESLTKEPSQEASWTRTSKNFLDGPPKVLQPFLTNRAKVSGPPPNLPLPVRNTMLAVALFPEFLKELAALAQEHSILCYKILGDFEDSCC